MKKIALSMFTATVLFSPLFGAEDLGEVIVTSSAKVPQKIKETTQNVTVITADYIKERGVQNVTELLSQVSGFTVASNGGAGQLASVFVRGLKSDNLLVLIDGVPLTDYSQPTSASALEHINIDSIERIEIVKGGQSGIWGASAAAGTINIITKGGLKDSATISIKGGSHSTKGAGIDFSKAFSKGSIAIGGHWLDTDGISALAGENAEKDGYKNTNYYLKGSVNLDKSNQLSLMVRGDEGKFDFDGSNANDKVSHGKSKQNIYALGYKYEKDALTVDAKVTHRKIDRSLVGTSAYGPWTYDTTAKSTQISLTEAYRFNNMQSLTLGAEHTINKAFTDSGFGKSEAKFKNSAVFASYTQSVASLLGADTTFNVVARYDKFDKFKNRATYRFGIKRECKVVEGLHSSANIYTGYKAPSLYQFSNASGELKPESLKGFDVTVGYKEYLNITYFSNKIKDKIVANFDPTTYKTSYSNSGDGVKTTGIEISSKYAFGESGFVLGANFTHMLKFKDDSGKKAQRVPQNSASVALDYYFGEASHIGVIANYVGKRRDVVYNSITFAQKDVTLKSYTTVDLTYNTRFKENFNLNITVKNIFDKKYETVKGYSTEGRSVYANLEYKF
jgi:vitamin B12 transporter